jgi:hypothetical protein
VGSRMFSSRLVRKGSGPSREEILVMIKGWERPERRNTFMERFGHRAGRSRVQSFFLGVGCKPSARMLSPRDSWTLQKIR